MRINDYEINNLYIILIVEILLILLISINFGVDMYRNSFLNLEIQVWLVIILLSFVILQINNSLKNKYEKIETRLFSNLLLYAFTIFTTILLIPSLIWSIILFLEFNNNITFTLEPDEKWDISSRKLSMIQSKLDNKITYQDNPMVSTINHIDFNILSQISLNNYDIKNVKKFDTRSPNTSVFEYRRLISANKNIPHKSDTDTHWIYLLIIIGFNTLLFMKLYIDTSFLIMMIALFPLVIALGFLITYFGLPNNSYLQFISGLIIVFVTMILLFVNVNNDNLNINFLLILEIIFFIGISLIYLQNVHEPFEEDGEFFDVPSFADLFAYGGVFFISAGLFNIIFGFYLENNSTLLYGLIFTGIGIISVIIYFLLRNYAKRLVVIERNNIKYSKYSILILNIILVILVILSTSNIITGISTYELLEDEYSKYHLLSFINFQRLFQISLILGLIFRNQFDDTEENEFLLIGRYANFMFILLNLAAIIIGIVYGQIIEKIIFIILGVILAISQKNLFVTTKKKLNIFYWGNIEIGENVKNTINFEYSIDDGDFVKEAIEDIMN